MIRLSGRFRSAMIIGGQGIRARKLRTLLSMMSLFLGVLAVVAVQAGAELAKGALLSDVELTQGKDGTLQIFVSANTRTVPVILDTFQGQQDAVAMINTTAVIGEPGVSPVNPGAASFDIDGGGRHSGSQASYVECDSSGICRVVTDDADVAPEGQAIALSLTALTGDVRQFRPFRPVSGQWLDFASAPSMAPRIVLNKEAAKGFARYRVPAQMRMDGATADATPQIIGVVDDGGSQPAAYMRSDELLTWLPMSEVSGSRSSGLQLFLSPSATDLERVLRARMTANGVAANQIHVQPINSLKQIAKQLALMRWIFLAMAGLVLLIGVAGILNVGLATVGERVEEFALRRAVGTSRLLLAGIVLAETLLTGLFTASAAIGFGALVLKVGAGMLSDRSQYLQHVEFPWQAGVAGVLAGLIAGLLGGLIPAIRAARIPIATVMRA